MNSDGPSPETGHQLWSSLAPEARIARLRAELSKRILVLDGAMGTLIQDRRLSEADYRGERFRDHPADLQGAHDLLALTRPDLLEELHRAYLEAGSDLVETNTFTSTSISLADYGLAEHAREINEAAARAARKAADAVAAATGRPRWVAGSIGPTNRTASLSPDVADPGFRNVTFRELADAYAGAGRGAPGRRRGPPPGGDGVRHAQRQGVPVRPLRGAGRAGAVHVPVMVSGTITDQSGRTLTGQTAEAFWNSMRHGVAAAFPDGRPPWRVHGDSSTGLFSFGFNCALGAKQLRPYVEEASGLADCWLTVHPNAGLPNELGGYDETPETHGGAGEVLRRGRLRERGGRVLRHGPRPHPGHRRRRWRGSPPRTVPEPPRRMRLCGLEPLTIGPDSLFVNVGERTNVTGSRRFRAPHRGRRLPGRPGRGAPAGGGRRPDPGREHGRGAAGLGRRHAHAS